MTSEKPLSVYVIGDYNDHLAFNEVNMRIEGNLFGRNINIFNQNVPAFDTMSTGFCLAQLAMNVPTDIEGYTENVKFFVNTAPRKDDPKIRVKCAGEGLVYFKLHNGVEGVAVNSGYSLAFVKAGATEIREIKADKDGSQFRSRDVFPKAFAEIVKGNYDILGEDIRENIPDVPENVVVWTDGYGNLKTSINPSLIAEATEKHVKMNINQRHIFGKVGSGIFGVEDGEFCVSVGSSGWTLPDGKDIRFTEVVLRGGNAARSVDSPHAGKKIDWKLVE